MCNKHRGVNSGGRKDACHLLPDLKLPNCDLGRGGGGPWQRCLRQCWVGEAGWKEGGVTTLRGCREGPGFCEGEHSALGPSSQLRAEAPPPHHTGASLLRPSGPGTISGGTDMQDKGSRGCGVCTSSQTVPHLCTCPAQAESRKPASEPPPPELSTDLADPRERVPCRHLSYPKAQTGGRRGGGHHRSMASKPQKEGGNC